jgi:hypothetical protein
MKAESFPQNPQPYKRNHRERLEGVVEFCGRWLAMGFVLFALAAGDAFSGAETTDA